MDGNLLSGLADLGLGDLESLDIYGDADKDDKLNKDEAQAAPVIKEEDFLFDKSFTCPVCDKDFKNKMIRAARVRGLEPDMDLRPRSEHIDALKYDIVACPHCGYAGTTKTFAFLTETQRKLVRENIKNSFKPKKENEESAIYTYDEALERHKLALVNAIVKRGKASEKAYICLKTGWLIRGMSEALSPDEANYEDKKQELLSTENQFLKNAYDGLLTARGNERFPICGMDQTTLDFLLSNLAIRFGDLEIATRLIGEILISKNTPYRIKDKARELKAILLQKVREQKSHE